MTPDELRTRIIDIAGSQTDFARAAKYSVHHINRMLAAKALPRSFQAKMCNALEELEALDPVTRAKRLRGE